MVKISLFTLNLIVLNLIALNISCLYGVSYPEETKSNTNKHNSNKGTVADCGTACNYQVDHLNKYGKLISKDIPEGWEVYSGQGGNLVTDLLILPAKIVGGTMNALGGFKDKVLYGKDPWFVSGTKKQTNELGDEFCVCKLEKKLGGSSHDITLKKIKITKALPKYN